MLKQTLSCLYSTWSLSLRQCRRYLTSTTNTVVLRTALAGIPAPYHKEKESSEEIENVEENDRGPECQAAESGLVRFGEDACFVSALVDGQLTFGVADGVGGWSRHGLDPGLVSQGLMGHAAYLFHRQSWPREEPAQALHMAYEALLKNADMRNEKDMAVTVAGSTTALLCEVMDNHLHAANLGDSGLLVIDHQGQLKLKSKPQGGMGGVFNCPTQLAVPSALAQNYPKPDACDEYSVELQPGDVVVAATDGFWDNVYPDTVAEMLGKWRAGELTRAAEQGVPSLAAYMCHVAYHLSMRTDYRSPFEQAAEEAGMKHEGGKMDDCTLVLAIASNPSET